MSKRFTILLLCFAVGMAPLASGQPASVQVYEQAFAQRARMVLQYAALHYPRSRPGYPPGWDGKLSDFGKYHYPMFLAQLALPDTNRQRQQILADRMAMFAQMPTFHFNLVGVPRMLYQFENHPVIQQHRLALLQRVWERTDSHNAWMAEGTENHISMSKTSAYLYAQAALRWHPHQFADAAAKLALMKRWIMDWSKRIYYSGTGEFNSAIYQAYTIAGWLSVYDFAQDPEVKAAARAVLDYYAAETALHYTQGMCGGADMRGQNCVRSFQGSYAYFGWLWYGDSPVPLSAASLDQGINTNEVIQTVHGALSSYRPPLAAAQLAAEKHAQPGWYRGSKPAYLLDRQGYIKQHLYISRHYMLGTGYFPYGGWGSGNNQTVSWKLISRVDSGEGKTAQFVSGIGIQSAADAKYAGGNKRSPYDQLVQHKNVLVQLTRLPLHAQAQKDSIRQLFTQWQQRWATDFAKRYPSDTDKLRHNPIFLNDLDVSRNQSAICVTTQGQVRSFYSGAVLFVELEKTIIAIRSVRGDAPTTLQPAAGTTMQYTQVTAPAGEICGFVLEVADKQDHPSADDFAQQIMTRTQLYWQQGLLYYRSLAGDELRVQYQPVGSFTEPMFDFGYGVQQPMLIPTAPPLQQPNWPHGDGHGRLARWWVNGTAQPAAGSWPVYSGPGLQVANGQLELRSRRGWYRVNYSGRRAQFSQSQPQP